MMTEPVLTPPNCMLLQQRYGHLQAQVAPLGWIAQGRQLAAPAVWTFRQLWTLDILLRRYTGSFAVGQPCGAGFSLRTRFSGSLAGGSAAPLLSQDLIEVGDQLVELLAQDAVVEEPRTEYELLRASYLVERRGVEAFDRRMDELAQAERERIGFTYIGPLPPHSFVGLSHGRR